MTREIVLCISAFALGSQAHRLWEMTRDDAPELSRWAETHPDDPRTVRVCSVGGCDEVMHCDIDYASCEIFPRVDDVVHGCGRSPRIDRLRDVGEMR